MKEKIFDKCEIHDDPEYRKVMNDPQYKEAKEGIEKFWEAYKTYADEGFAKHLRKNFFPRIWELWLGNILLHDNFDLDSRHATVWPDFIASKDGNIIYIEATCPCNATEDSGNAVEELNPYCFTEIKPEKTELRLQNAINTKYKEHFLELREIHVPYVIAICTRRIPWSQYTFDDIPVIVKALYPIGKEIMRIQNGLPTRKFERVKQHGNLKASNGYSSKEIFCNSNYSFLSAVIISATPISLEEGNIKKEIFIIKNPHAEYPINSELQLDEYVVDFSENCFTFSMNPISRKQEN